MVSRRSALSRDSLPDARDNESLSFFNKNICFSEKESNSRQEKALNKRRGDVAWNELFLAVISSCSVDLGIKMFSYPLFPSLLSLSHLDWDRITRRKCSVSFLPTHTLDIMILRRNTNINKNKMIIASWFTDTILSCTGSWGSRVDLISFSHPHLHVNPGANKSLSHIHIHMFLNYDFISTQKHSQSIIWKRRNRSEKSL